MSERGVRQWHQWTVLDSLATALGKATAAVVELSEAVDRATAALDALGEDPASAPTPTPPSPGEADPLTMPMPDLAAHVLGIDTADPVQTHCFFCRTELQQVSSGETVCPECNPGALV